MTEQQVQQLIEAIANYMTENNVPKQVVENVCKMVESAVDKKDYIVALIKFIEKKYYELYGDEAGEFVNYPISPKLRMNIGRFKNDNGLELDGYKKFASWMLENCHRLYKRKMRLLDLVSQTSYKLYKEEGGEEVVVERKRRFSKSMFIN